MINSFTVSEEEARSKIERGGYVIRMVVPEKKTILVYDELEAL